MKVVGATHEVRLNIVCTRQHSGSDGGTSDATLTWSNGLSYSQSIVMSSTQLGGSEITHGPNNDGTTSPARDAEPSKYLQSFERSINRRHVYTK